jgi:hypothetical protein
MQRIPFLIGVIDGREESLQTARILPHLHSVGAVCCRASLGGVQIPVTRSIARVPSRHPFSFFTNSHAHSPHFDIQ